MRQKINFYMNVLLCTTLIFCVTGALFAAEEFVYDSHGRRDPFVPLVSEGGGFVSDTYGIKSAEDVRLEGIVWEEGKRSMAVINGEIFRAGQSIGELNIVEIQRDGVVFEAGDERIKVELRDE